MTESTFKRAHKQLQDEEKQALYGHSCFEMTRAKTKVMMDTQLWHFMCASCVCFGFLCVLAEAQLLPKDGSEEGKIFFYFDCAVTGFFSLERNGRCFSPCKADSNRQSCQDLQTHKRIGWYTASSQTTFWGKDRPCIS
jgi:hypothetical protein